MTRNSYLAWSLALMMAFATVGCNQQEAVDPPAETAASEDTTAVDDDNIAVIETSMGTIKVELYEAKTPITVANFKNLVKQGFYDDTIFHRVIAGFMNQGGGFTTDYKDKVARAGIQPIQMETHPELKHVAGAVSMARLGHDRNSATSQFFIVAERAPHLDGQYAMFGQVIEGMDVVEAINQVRTGMGQIEQRIGPDQYRMGTVPDVPVEPVIIESIRLESRG